VLNIQKKIKNMNLEEALLTEFSKAQMLRLSEWIGEDTQRFQMVVDFMIKGECKLMQRAAWLLSYCFDIHPHLIEPHLKTLTENLQNTAIDAVKRNTLRVLQSVTIPEDLSGILANVCFDYLSSQQEAVAVKVFAMSVLANIAQKEPELKNELKILIEEQMPYSSAGFQSRGKKILKKL
jgi:hypothetical protein